MELLQLLSQDDLVEMQLRFGSDGLELDDFIACFSDFLGRKVARGEAGEEVLLRWSPASTANLFREIDYNGDGSVSWEEFTSFAISVAFANNSSAQVRKDENFKDYIQQPFSLQNQSSQLKQLVYVPGFERLVACGFTRTTVHDTATSTCRGILETEGTLLDATYLSHLSLLVTSTDANYVQFYDTLDKFSCRKRMIADRAFTKWIHPVTAPSLGSLRLVGGDREGALHILSVDKLRSNANSVGTNVRNITVGRRVLHTDSISSLHFVEHSARNSFLSSSLDNTLLLSDPETGSVTMNLVSGHAEYIRHVSVSTMHRLYVACGGETFATAASLDHRQVTPFVLQDVRLPHVHNLVGVHAVPNTHQIITADSGGTVKLWDARQFKCVTTFQLPRGSINSVVNVAGKGAAVKARAQGNMGIMNSFVYINPRKSLITVGRETLNFAYDKRQTGRTAHSDPIVALIYISQTHSVITATSRELRVWSVMSGLCVAHFMDLQLEANEEVTVVAVDAMSGRRLFIGTTLGNIACILPTTGKKIWTHCIIAPTDDIGDMLCASDGDDDKRAFLAATPHAGRAGADSMATRYGGAKLDPDHFGAKYRNNKIVFVYMIDRRSFLMGSAAGEIFLWLEEDLFPQTRVFPPLPVNTPLMNVSPDEALRVAKQSRRDYDAALNPISVHCFSLVAGLLVFSLDEGNKLMVMEVKARSVTHVNNDGYGPQAEITAISFIHETASGNELSTFAVGDAFGAVHIWTIRNKNIFGAPTQHLATVHTPRHVGVASLCVVHERYLVAGLAKAVLVVWDVRDIMNAVTHYVSPDNVRHRSVGSVTAEVGSLGARLMQVAQKHEALLGGVRKAAESGLAASSPTSPSSPTGASKLRRSELIGKLAGESVEETSLKKIEEKLRECDVPRVFFGSPDQDYIGYLAAIGTTGLFAAATVEDDPLVRIFSADGDSCGLLCQGRETEAPSSILGGGESQPQSPTAAKQSPMTRVSSTVAAELAALGTYRVRHVLQTRKLQRSLSIDAGENPSNAPADPEAAARKPSSPLLHEEDHSVLPIIAIDLSRARGPELGLQELNRVRRKNRRHRIKHGNKQHIAVESLDEMTTPRLVHDLIAVEAAHKARTQQRITTAGGHKGSVLALSSQSLGMDAGAIAALVARGSTSGSLPATSPAVAVVSSPDVSSRRRWHQRNQPRESTDDSSTSIKPVAPQARHKTKMSKSNASNGATVNVVGDAAVVTNSDSFLPQLRSAEAPSMTPKKRFVSGAVMLSAHGSQQRQDEKRGEVSLRGAQLATREDLHNRAVEAREERERRKRLESSPAARRFFAAKLSLEFLSKLKRQSSASHRSVETDGATAMGAQTARQPQTTPFSAFARNLLMRRKEGPCVEGVETDDQLLLNDTAAAESSANDALKAINGDVHGALPPPRRDPMSEVSSALGFLSGTLTVTPPPMKSRTPRPPPPKM